MFVTVDRAIGNPLHQQPNAAMDEDDDKTVTSAGSGKNERDFVETTVKWCINNMSDATKAKLAVAEILATMLFTFSEELVIVDNKGEEFVHVENQTEAELKEKVKKGKFTVHQATSRSERRMQRWYCIHTLRSNQSLSSIKQHYVIMSKIKQMKAYVTTHQFDQDKWDIAHLGFLQGYNVQHMGSVAAKMKVLHDAQKIDPNCPKFELSTARIRSGQSDHRAHITQAYEIQCHREDARKMIQIFKSGDFKTAMSFVPYAYKKTKPEAFLNAIKLQNKNLTETWVLKIEGFTEDAIKHVSKQLLSRPGASDIVPSYGGKDKGEWKILISKNNMKNYYTWLSNELPAMIESLPQVIQQATPDNFPIHSINSRPPATYQDEDEDDDSYGTMFSNAMSVATAAFDETTFEIPDELDRKFDLPEELQPARSYAATVSGTKSTSQVSDLSSHKHRTLRSPPVEVPRSYTALEDQIEKMQLDHQAALAKMTLEKLSLSQELAKLTAQVVTQQAQVEQQTTNTSKLESMVEQLMTSLRDTQPHEPSPKRKSLMQTPQRLTYSEYADPPATEIGPAGQQMQE
jgi:hypothetical protein